LSASKLSLALEGGKLIVGGVVVVAAVKDVGETGCKLYLFVELIGELGVEQHYYGHENEASNGVNVGRL